jgi:hypothetical protein
MNTGQYSEVVNQMRETNKQLREQNKRLLEILKELKRLNEIRLAVNRIDDRLRESPSQPAIIVVNGGAGPEAIREDVERLLKEYGR